MDDMEKIVLEYVTEEYLEDDDDEITADTPLISGGIVDSFSMVSLKRFLENRYTISIPDDKATPEKGSQNESAVPWDLISDLRHGGEIRVDGELLYENGQFVIDL